MTTTSKNRRLVSALRDWLKGLATAGLLSGTLAINPVPASRPRVTRWGTYYGKTYERFKKEGLLKADALPKVQTDGPVVLLIDHVVQKPKTSKLDSPRGDTDNYVKSTLDVLTKAQRVYNDDDQVVALFAFKRFAEADEEPGIVIDALELSALKV